MRLDRRTKIGVLLGLLAIGLIAWMTLESWDIAEREQAVSEAVESEEG